jgi:proteasome lid subunit RPN8/RPN11
VIIDRAAYDAMIQHMQEAAPREGVGLLAGPRSPLDHIPYELRSDVPHVDRWVPLRNTAEFPRARYEADPGELISAWETLEVDGRRPWIIVHSHVRTSAAPSDLDIRYAVDPTLLHMIVSLAGTDPVAVLWRLNPNVTAPNHAKKIHYQVVDLGFQGNVPTDLTRGVSGA